VLSKLCSFVNVPLGGNFDCAKVRILPAKGCGTVEIAVSTCLSGGW
jgi:hypothetical protein